MPRATHISDDDLMLFTDQEMGAEPARRVESHLRGCRDCRRRVEELLSGAAAYEQYRERVLKPALDPPAMEWPALRDRISKQQRPRSAFGLAPAALWAGAVFACCVIAAALYFERPAEPGMGALLTKAAGVPEGRRGSLLMITNRHKWSRPAILREGDPVAAGVPAVEQSSFQHVRALFVQAHYSWQDPVSARSFAAWRNQLPEKRDEVTLLRNGSGATRFYRLRTRTAAGILRTASLTLRADTYHATDAEFEFQGEDPVELTEQSAEESHEIARSGQQEAQEKRLDRPKVTETIASPEDELRVFAMLSAIGVDAEEPVDVKFDAGRHHVVVTGMGMPLMRQKEVEKALAELPHTVVHFDSAQPRRSDARASALPDTYSADNAIPFRQTLEARAGGPRQFQALTDRALDTSNALFAHAHSLLVLAQEFPPEVEVSLSDSDRKILAGLQQRHVGAIEYAVRQLREDVKPLLEGEAVQNSAARNIENSLWQRNAPTLFEAARNLDQLVSRLLGGSYSEAEGRGMLSRLPNDLLSVEMQARAQTGSSR